MNQSAFTPLDNPVWEALRSTQQSFALGDGAASRYEPHILPFVGFDPAVTAPLATLHPYISAGEQLFAVGALPPTLSGWQVIKVLEGIQMICPEPVTSTADTTVIIEQLTTADHAAMYALVNAVQPGYYRPQTPLLGNYWGIKAAGKLVAMAGQRFQLPGFIEVSAVCTYPEHTGKGYAQLLTKKVCDQIHQLGAIPFLHVLQSNTRAIRVYEKLGFYKRCDILFYQLGVPENKVL